MPERVDESVIDILPVAGMWGDHRWWENLAQSCKETDIRVHPFDLPQHGRLFTSRWKLRFTSIEDCVAALVAEVRKYPKIPRLAGHSLGCHIIEAALPFLPEPPPAIFLLGPTCHRTFRNSVATFARHHPWRFIWLNLTLSMWAPVSTISLAREMLFPLDMPDEEVRKYHVRMQDESYRIALQLLLGRGPRRVPAPEGVPVYVIGGRKDRAVRQTDVERVAAFHGTSVKWVNLPHNLLLSPGWEEVAEFMKARLAGHHGGPFAGT